MTPKRPVRTLTEIIILGLAVIALLNYQALADRYALATFHPAAPMAAIIDRLGLTQQGEAILYRAKPQLDQKTPFNSDCATTKGELELGCFYHARVFVLQIDNASLASEMDVVTAHELLHAAYERMSSTERQQIDAELERVYAGITDQDLRDRMASYAQSEPGQQDNELHSILGTEYTSLSPLLEQHYAKYFTNRSAIVAAHGQYESVFSGRRSELEGELATIRSEKSQLATLNAQMEAYRRSGAISAYNALVPRQNQLVDDINQRITAYRSGVDEYNALSRSLDSQAITDTEPTVQ